MAICVLRDESFKATSKRLDIHPNTLETIVHKFINMEGREGQFPTDAEIKAELEPSPFKASKDQLELYNREKHGEPTYFGSRQEAINAYNELQRFYPKSAISFYRNSNGLYVVKVGSPVKTSTEELSINDFIGANESREAYERELQEILDKAPRNEEGKLLVRQGGPVSNLNERQYAQVRTKAFKEWFGDWINDPENASKVVDENGEPLVVYHGSPNYGFNTFSLETGDRMGRTTQGLSKKFYFTKDIQTAMQFALSDAELEELHNAGNPEEYKESGIEVSLDNLKGRVYSAFLNIKNPYNIDAEGKAVYQLTEKQREEINKSEGSIVTNALESLPPRLLELMPEADKFLENPHTTDYIVSSSNQIKSATNNVGTFAPNNPDINFNLIANELYDIVKYMQGDNFVTDYHQSSDGEEKSSDKIHIINKKKYDGDFWLKKHDSVMSAKEGAEYSTELSKEYVKEYLQSLGLENTGIITFRDTNKGTVVEYHPEALRDFIEESEAMISLGRDTEASKFALNVRNFLTNRLGVKFQMIQRSSAEKLLTKNNKSLPPNARAFYLDGTAYFISGYAITADRIAEECLHPFTGYLRDTNPTLFRNLLQDAKELFPKLHLQIKEAYEESDVDIELVTQALARTFKEERALNPEGRKKESFIGKFLNWLLSYFSGKPILNFDNKTVTLKDIAAIINSDAELNYNKAKELKFNKTQEEQRVDIDAEETNKPTLEDIQLAYTRHQKILETQINNLMESKYIPASEVRHIADQVAWLISDHITDLQTKEGYAKECYPELEKVDFSKLSRADVVRRIGPGNVMNWCKNVWFSPKNNKYNYRGIDLLAVRDITNNWEGVMLLAQNTLLTIEDFSIVSNPTSGEHEVNTDITANPDDYNGPQDAAEIEENEGSQQEHWQVETKTLDVLQTMSQQVKLALSKLIKVDANGNPIVSRFGIVERVNVREATNFILRNCQGALTLADMVEKLSTKADSNPWVNSLIQRLSDKTGAETDFKSQFFSAFAKHFQTYSVVKYIDGEYQSIIVNENPALTEATKQIIAQFKINEHPMFTSEGVNEETYAKFKEELKTLEKYAHLDKKGKAYDLNDPAIKKEVATSMGYLSNLLGYYVTPEMVEENLDAEAFKTMYNSLQYISTALSKNIGNSTYNPFNYRSKDGIKNNLDNFLRPITKYFDDVTVACFNDNGKMYQSYITPSYMSKLMNKFAEKDPAKFRQFMQEEYGKYDWFRDQSQVDGTRGWRNSLIESLSRDQETREKFKHKVQLNFNKKEYMKKMDDMEYVLSVFTEFTSKYNATGKRQWSWYRMPMQSNKPSSEYVRMERFIGPNYRDIITDKVFRIFNQELSRIQTVLKRNYTAKDQRFIKNFDKNGKRFNFLPFMNDFLDGNKKNSELGKYINDAVNGRKVTNLSDFYTKAKAEIKNAIQERANKIMAEWEQQGIIEAAKKVSNAGKNKAEIRANLENFIWNDNLAAMNLMELTITDIAYYKDAEDLQKRLAQLHAPGTRGDIMALDYGGEGREATRVTDGISRTFYLSDWDNFISNIIDNVTIVFNRRIENARKNNNEQEAKGLEVLKDSLVRPRTYKEDGSVDDAGGLYWNINVADAQGYNSPTSYRKKAFIFGKWSREAEAVYQKLIKGDYNYNDLKVAFQPLKPFVYSQIEKSSGIPDAPLRNLKVGVQNKNSEYLLIMADAILQGENTGKANLLRAVYDIMEESHFEKGHYGDMKYYRTDGIDTVQFESTVKAGLMGKLNLHQYVNVEGGEAMAKEVLKANIYSTNITKDPNTGKEVTSIGYNDNVVHKISYEDYCLQQEVPQHFRENKEGQLHGSQLRYIIVSDLATVDDFGNEVRYNIGNNKVSAEDFKKEYEDTVAANIEDSISKLIQMFSLDNMDIVKRNTTLSKLLQKEILSSPRYGVDLYQACSVDENGKFRIPLGDPIQSKRVEQLINSIIKNHVNKQKIAGGPVVQVSNFGTSRQLNIKFKNRNKEGELLMTREEWNNSSSPSKEATYEDYIKKNQGGIAYFEVFAPMYINKLFENFADENGVINIDAIETLDPDLLKLVGYRIPTEAKYSMAPLKIVGFLPREAGDGIMLPYDITLLTGSDFDVDKEYLMRKDLNIKTTKNMSNVASLLDTELMKHVKEGASKVDAMKEATQIVKNIMQSPFNKKAIIGSSENFNITEDVYKKLLTTYVKNKYTVENPEDIVAQRNNKIVDMTYEVLTHETSAAEMLNPGGFDPQKRMGYMVEAYKTSDKSWEELEDMSIDDLKDLANKDKNLMFIDTHVQFYRQNNAAGALIGIFAVNRVAHAVIENEGYQIDIEKAMGENEEPFTLEGMRFEGNMQIDVRKDRSGEFVGKVLGSLVASAADAVKDPVLNLMNINKNTANVLNTLIRLGMPFDDAALFLSQRAITNILATLNKENIQKGFASLQSTLYEAIKEIEAKSGISKDSIIQKEELTKEELIRGLKEEDEKITYKTLKTLSKLIKIADAMRLPTAVTRFNSITSAVGPLVIDNLMAEKQLEELVDNSCILDKSGELVGAAEILKSHKILQQFARGYGLAKLLFGTQMPANSTGFDNILNRMSGSRLGKAIIRDRQLMGKLSDFYQSYLAVAGGIVDSSKVSDVINKFPKEFLDKKYKEKYKDNAFIQAIRYDTDKSGRMVLTINTTGLDMAEKERLSSGWVDLHRVNSELSLKLFEYCFFKGGMGFSPKTFMNLVPIYVKERIPNYINTFERLPSISSPDDVIDQFIRHNWNDKKVVRHVDVTKDENHPFFNGKVDGKLIPLADMEGVQKKYKLEEGDYVVIKNFNTTEDVLYKLTTSPEDIGPSYVLKQVDPLGDNGEFLEITIDGKEKSIAETKEAIEDDAPAELTQDTDPVTPYEEETELTDQEAEDLLYKIYMSKEVYPGHYRTKEEAKETIDKVKTAPKNKSTMNALKTFLEARLEDMGVPYNEKLIDQLYNKLC